MTKEEWYKQLFERLAVSKFRSSFHLKENDFAYIEKKGLAVIEKLKMQDQMEWVRKMNNIRSRAVEIIDVELICV